MQKVIILYITSEHDKYYTKITSQLKRTYIPQPPPNRKIDNHQQDDRNNNFLNKLKHDYILS